MRPHELQNTTVLVLLSHLQIRNMSVYARGTRRTHKGDKNPLFRVLR